MSGFRPDRTSHGNYRCPYCNHKVWKRDEEAAARHIEENHHDEADKANDKLKIERLETEKRNLEYKLKVYSKPPEKKTEYYDAVWYCHNCLKLHSGGLPKGVLISNISCGECGVCALHIVTNVSKFWTKS